MPRKKKTSARERILIGIGVLAVLVTLYVVYRYKAEQTAIAVLTEQAETAEANVKKTKLPRLTGESAKSIQDAVEKAKGELELLETALGPLEAGFVATDSPEAVQGVMVDISALAKTSAVVIREASALTETGPGRQARPMRQLIVEGSYGGLHAFLDGLVQLPKRVVVERFSIRTVAVKTKDAKVRQRLESVLVVSL